jgi:hypothetical protein
VVEALPALRGVQGTVAVTLVATMGDLTRFESPRALLKLMGLMPSEHSSGEQRRQGAITKAGTTHARRVLVEGAWAYRSSAKVSRHLPRRLDKQPQVIQDSSGTAQVRLGQRSRRLGSRGKHAKGVTVAIARELTGFMWAIAKEVPIAVSDPIDSPWPVLRKPVQPGKVPRGIGQGAAPVGWNPRRREEACTGDSGLA